MRKLLLLSFFAAPGLLASSLPILAEPQLAVSQPMTAAMINDADLGARFASPQRTYIVAPKPPASDGDASPDAAAAPDPAIARLQILLDQQGASPGVVDGFDGENMRKAVMGIQVMAGRGIWLYRIATPLCQLTTLRRLLMPHGCPGDDFRHRPDDRGPRDSAGFKHSSSGPGFRSPVGRHRKIPS